MPANQFHGGTTETRELIAAQTRSSMKRMARIRQCLPQGHITTEVHLVGAVLLQELVESWTHLSSDNKWQNTKQPRRRCISRGGGPAVFSFESGGVGFITAHHSGQRRRQARHWD
mmetsp:Transcript_12880/g.29086  ORF Transcript_12880/g.29086 Transcript_12880/m.29086 type:complete len:115 (-) Transcript_12880:1158-1502(-)